MTETVTPEVFDPSSDPNSDLDPAAPGEWIAIHIYYAANPQPLLTRCVREIFRELDDARLVSRYFFINYWLEGPHVRMRLKPTTAGDAPRVREIAERRIGEFLQQRPALYEVDTGFLSDLYNTLFDMEFNEEEKQGYTGADGRMNLRPNNAFVYLPYEPEYGKYGGPEGVELAEWHFQQSSDLVIDALRTMNLHLRTVLLGTSAQLMMVMSATFIDDRDELAAFLGRYHDFWEKAFGGTGFIAEEAYRTGYEKVGAELGRRFEQVLSATRTGQLDDLPEFLRGWALHCRELRARATALAEQGVLSFASWDGTRDETVDDPAVALVILLSSYMHMTNNRFHVTVRDEAYLAYVSARVLRESSSTVEHVAEAGS
jgi:Lantibiotic biosynthesis dehydratase C-term